MLLKLTPASAQGAAQAVEDGALLGHLFEKNSAYKSNTQSFGHV